MTRARILVVEDEVKLAAALREGLEAEQYSVTTAQSGEEGFFLAHAQAFDLIILDVMLPGRDGLEILATLRREGNATPVMVLTARDTVEDRVQGLDAGADDYLVKPFAFPELLARLRALLRRGRSDAPQKLTLADLELDCAGRSVVRGGKTLDLTGREFELLEYFLRHQGRVVSREMLARDIWHEPARFTPLDNVIDVHVARLRRKIDDQFSEKLVHTVRGVGFVMREEGRP
jgi:DNA-binding response OmpR family regulator